MVQKFVDTPAAIAARIEESAGQNAVKDLILQAFQM
jgi:hypothetical protein